MCVRKFYYGVLLAAMSLLSACVKDSSCKKQYLAIPHAHLAAEKSVKYNGLETWETKGDAWSQADEGDDVYYDSYYGEDGLGCLAGIEATAMAGGDMEVGAEPDAMLDAPLPYPYPYPSPQAGVLTAGHFDDSLNLSVFERFWNSSTPSYYGEQRPQVELPSFEQIDVAPRFDDNPKNAIDISFVIDATGSMGDEIDYIKKEVEHISTTVNRLFPEVQQRFSLIVYRDHSDQYLTRGVHFTSDLQGFISYLNQQQAGGGGDYPEAVEHALGDAVTRLRWGDDSVAKVMFFIADAPPHNESVDKTLSTVEALKEKGVHIYPVAASGVRELAEKVMRYSALVTGGEYLFITDDSGVGNPHAEPHIPCYNVGHLNDLLILKILEELSQERLQLAPDQVIRKIGNPVNGVCEELEAQ